jgi:uncharacterized protein YdaU (DUF1376 family)
MSILNLVGDYLFSFFVSNDEQWMNRKISGEMERIRERGRGREAGGDGRTDPGHDKRAVNFVPSSGTGLQSSHISGDASETFK